MVSGNIWSKNYDGCYFDSGEYEENKSYLALFDTLDCKLIKYLGYSTSSMVPNIILYSAIMLVPNYFFPDGVISKVIGGIGSVLFGMMMTFLFLIIGIIIKAVYIFTSAFFTLSILIFISPIVLPLMFFERTKSIFDTWTEYVMDSILKPIMNFSFTMMYISVMDIILLKDATFSQHSARGRGVNLNCPDNSSSFICLINGFPIIGQIKILFSAGLKSVLFDVVVVFLFFSLFDKVLDDLESISSSIFKSISDATKSSSSLLSTKDKSLGIGDIGGQAFGKAMDAGKQIEAFRTNYVNNAPGAILSGVKKAADKVAQNRVDPSKTRFRALGKVGEATAGTAGLVGKAYDGVSNLAEKLENKAWGLKHKAGRLAKQKLKGARDAVKSKVKEIWNRGPIHKLLNKAEAKDVMKEARTLKSNARKNSKDLRPEMEYRSKMQNMESLDLSPEFIDELIENEQQSIRENENKKRNLTVLRNRRGKNIDREIEGQKEIIKDLKKIAAKNLRKDKIAEDFLKKNMKLKKNAASGQKKQQKYADNLEKVERFELPNDLIDDLVARGELLIDGMDNDDEKDAMRGFMDDLNNFKN
ncbi:MAG: type IV secretion system protein [Rickettsiales bacterium]|nr:type IV secretion system protein [Rickettsiales bacterium]